MANTRSLTRCLYLALVRPRLMASSTTLSFLLPSPKLKSLEKTVFNSSSSSSLSFSTTSTSYPLQYEMIISRPTQSSLAQNRRRPARGTKPNLDNSPEAEESLGTELGFESWVDKKLASDKETARPGSENLGPPQMDKAKRKYYNKRRKRMYGTDSDEDGKRDEGGFVELKPEVVDFPRLFPREEELFFYDTFAYPWDKEKHYKMVYQLEKKYFPDQCLDKAFLEPGESNEKNGQGKVKNKKKGVDKKDGDSDDRESEGLVFFDEGRGTQGKGETLRNVSTDITEKKVEEFFKYLKKAPNEGSEVAIAEPYFVSRSTTLPPTWDGPHGTVLLVNKPKGWTSFTVCGKLRRLVNVKKVGHAGTLDPMATGLLIVCIGKATKVVDSFQGMTKGYSGVFRLGEATSTWDADSPVIQREPWEHVKDVDIKKTAASFLGEIWQVPPMFSAIKVGGEKMYEKARRGENIELSPRRISIFQFDIERSLEDRQNLVFRVTCSKGTYIRSLCADFGKALGSCAHLTALRRDSIGEYCADDAWDFKELEESIPKSYL